MENLVISVKDRAFRGVMSKISPNPKINGVVVVLSTEIPGLIDIGTVDHGHYRDSVACVHGLLHNRSGVF